MWEIVGDPQVGANFVVLMIVRLSSAGQLEGTATVYLPGHQVSRRNWCEASWYDDKNKRQDGSITPRAASTWRRYCSRWTLIPRAVTLSHIPRWLTQDGFTAMTCEAMGDTEAKFFVPAGAS